ITEEWLRRIEQKTKNKRPTVWNTLHRLHKLLSPGDILEDTDTPGTNLSIQPLIPLDTKKEEYQQHFQCMLEDNPFPPESLFLYTDGSTKQGLSGCAWTLLTTTEKGMTQIANGQCHLG